MKSRVQAIISKIHTGFCLVLSQSHLLSCACCLSFQSSILFSALFFWLLLFFAFLSMSPTHSHTSPVINQACMTECTYVYLFIYLSFFPVWDPRERSHRFHVYVDEPHKMNSWLLDAIQGLSSFSGVGIRATYDVLTQNLNHTCPLCCISWSTLIKLHLALQNKEVHSCFSSQAHPWCSCCADLLECLLSPHGFLQKSTFVQTCHGNSWRRRLQHTLILRTSHHELIVDYSKARDVIFGTLVNENKPAAAIAPV